MNIEDIQPGELKPCPFCGAGEILIHVNKGVWTGMRYAEPISIEVRHWCTKIAGQPGPRLLAFVGRDRASAVEAWNKRFGAEAKALDLLQALFTQPYMHLGDLSYNIREREGRGWDGPAVKTWSALITEIYKLLGIK